MEIKPGMMRYPIREHDKVGSTLTAEENNHIAMQLGFEISEAK
jgi:hypothetical protein